MNDQSKIANNTRGHQYDGDGLGRMELLQSESPQVQQKLLLQQLSQEIVNSQRIRYREAELHYRNFNSSPTHQSLVDYQQVQSNTLTDASNNNSVVRSPNSTSKSQNSDKPISRRNSSTTTPAKALDQTREPVPQASTKTTTKNCQVCLIKAVRQDLMNINKIVQERNEQISKLLDPILKPSR